MHGASYLGSLQSTIQIKAIQFHIIKQNIHAPLPERPIIMHSLSL